MLSLGGGDGNSIRQKSALSTLKSSLTRCIYCISQCSSWEQTWQKEAANGHELEEQLQGPLHSSNFQRLAHPKTRAVGCSGVAEGIRTVSLCKSHTKSSISLTLCGESDSKALNLALCHEQLCCSLKLSFGCTFSLVNLLFIAAHSVPFFPGQVMAVLFQVSTGLSLIYRNWRNGTESPYAEYETEAKFPSSWCCYRGL